MDKSLDPDLPTLRTEHSSWQTESRGKIIVLPSYPNAFIGRTRHIQAIGELLKEEDKRLITLLGPGGIGKTRLSVTIGKTLKTAFEHGVCFVPLDAVTDHEQVPLYIVQGLGLKGRQKGLWIPEILDFLQEKEFLLILDNLEQILESASFIDQIIRNCPGVKILATSRETLDLSYEIEYPLDGLNRPNPRIYPDPQGLLVFDAIDLFVQKARAARPDFQLTRENSRTVVEICQELEGLPLPIELAAARIKLFSPELILEELQQSTNLLRTRSKDVISRHQTIRNTVKWSYDLLNAEEKELFQQLALFRSGFTLTAIESVCSHHDALEVVELFINKSLIVKGEEIAGIQRFRMLKVIRDFGLEQLADNPNRSDYNANFTAFFLDFLEKGNLKYEDAGQSKWIALIGAEYENLIATLEWLAGNRPEQAGRLGVMFWRFHLNRGFLREGLDMIETLLKLHLAEKKTNAQLLEGAGVIAQNLGNYLDAKGYLKRCLDLWRELQDKTEITKALNNLGWVEWRLGNYDQSISYSENAIALSGELGDLQAKAKSLNNLAWTYMRQGLFEQKEELQRQILEIHSTAGDEKGIAFAKTNLGWALLETGKIAEAETLLEESVELYKKLQHQQLLTFTYAIKAFCLYEQQKPEEARELLEKYCLVHFERIGDVWGIALCLDKLGDICREAGNYADARSAFQKSLAIHRSTHSKYGAARSSLGLSRLQWADGEFAEAGKSLNTSLALAAEMGANQLLTEGHFEWGKRHLNNSSHQVALTGFAVADHYAAKLGAYQYQRLFSRIMAEIRQMKTDLKDGLAEMAFKGWEQQNVEKFLSGPVSREDLERRIRNLLEAAPKTGSTPKAALEFMADSGPFNQLPEEQEDYVVRQVRKVLEQRIRDRHFTINNLCREIGISYSQLNRKINDHTGLSVNKYVVRLRLNRAKELLADPALTIAAIAFDTGFKDPDYFYRLFKKTFQMTPGEFRQAQLREK